MLATSHPTAMVLMYHSISSASEDIAYPRIVVSPANFEWQMDYLASRMNVISLATLLSHLSKGAPLPAGSVVITFDDGYRDNYLKAFPVLEKYGLPATFFLSTDYIGTGKIKWEDRLSRAVRRNPASTLLVDLSTRGLALAFDTSAGAKRLKAIDGLIALLSGIDDQEREYILAELERQAGVKAPDREAPRVMLAWDEVRAMASNPLMTFGSHGAAHHRLSRASTPTVEEEIRTSKAEIENQTGCAVKWFAYPYGTPRDFDNRCKSILRAAGFDCALTTVYGRNTRTTDPFALRRIGAPNLRGAGFSLGVQVRGSSLGQPMRAAYDFLSRRLP